MEVFTFGDEYHGADGLFSVLYTKRYIISVSLSSDDVNFGDLVYVISAKYPAVK